LGLVSTSQTFSFEVGMVAVTLAHKEVDLFSIYL